MKQEIEQKLIQRRDKILDSPELAAIAKLESEVTFGFLEYCRENDFILVNVPHLTLATGACENFSTVFSADLQGTTTYLSQTGQLYLEAFLHKFPKTCCVGPSFRKEERVDSRHAIEFTLLEIEVTNCDLAQLRRYAEEIIQRMIKNMKDKCQKELEILGIDLSWLETFNPPYNAITYSEAIKKLGLSWGSDLSHEQEQELVRQNGFKPLFVTHYPKEIKFFNMRTNREDSKIVNSMDMLMPYSGESLGAAEREENYELLKKRLEDSKMVELMIDSVSSELGMQGKSKSELKEICISRFKWYVEHVKKYPLQHAGFGMGGNRIFQSLLGARDIRVAGSYVVNKETLL
jgi:asparaginyl-tRNA synthetase